MTVQLIGVHDVDTVWPHITDIVQLAINQQHHGYSVGDFWTLCRSGRGFLFVRDPVNAVVIATSVQQNGTPVFSVDLIAATSREKAWRTEMMDAVVAVAKAAGAKRIVGDGRKNFQKLCPARIHSVRYEMEID